MPTNHPSGSYDDPYDLEWARQVLQLLGNGRKDEAITIAADRGPDGFTPVSESWNDVVPALRGPCDSDFGVPASHVAANAELLPSSKHIALAHVFRRGVYRCAYCGRGLLTPLVVIALKFGIGPPHWPVGRNFVDCHPIVVPNYPALEHIWPVSRGGHKRHGRNLVAACWRCNLTKGNTLLAELGWASPCPTPASPYDGLVGEALRAWFRIEPDVGKADYDGWPSVAVATVIVKGHEQVDAEIVASARRHLLEP